MTLMQHLGELRSRLIASFAAFLILSIVAFIFYEPLLEFLTQPLCTLDADQLGPQGCRLIYTGVLGGFQFRLKMTALVGLAAASPFWLYHVWAFVVPALTLKERKLSRPFLAAAILLFLTGATLAYLTLPTGIKVLVALGGSELVPFFKADEYLNFVGLMLIGFGVTFELPLVLIFLGLAEVITVQQLRTQRKAALVSIVALAAIITPSQDPYTMLVLAVPLYGLYEVTILVLSAMMKRRAKASG
jgi:sec-independent protein translocase protein TatC